MPRSRSQTRTVATRADVAKAAKVSQATVSFVLNGQAEEKRVAEATQRRVLEAARRLRYLPNSAARAMVGRRHLTVGIITSRRPGSLHAPIFGDFAVAAVDEAARHQHTVKFLPSVSEAGTYDVFGALRDAQVDGLIVHNLGKVSQALAEWSMPFVHVSLGDDPADLPLDRVALVFTDEARGLRAAARHLAECGHVEIGLLSGDSPGGVLLPRYQAFVEEFELRTNGRGVLHCLDGHDWTAEDGYECMRRLLEEWPAVTAVQAGNDWMALGAAWAVHESGRRIPDDIAIVGFGDFPNTAYHTPPLTTVRWPLREVGTTAVDLLVAQLRGEGGIGQTTVPTELIIRRSTGGSAGQ